MKRINQANPLLSVVELNTSRPLDLVADGTANLLISVKMAARKQLPSKCEPSCVSIAPADVDA